MTRNNSKKISELGKKSGKNSWASKKIEEKNPEFGKKFEKIPKLRKN